jgi:hypothetical protein
LYTNPSFNLDQISYKVIVGDFNNNTNYNGVDVFSVLLQLKKHTEYIINNLDGIICVDYTKNNDKQLINYGVKTINGISLKNNIIMKQYRKLNADAQIFVPNVSKPQKGGRYKLVRL